MIGMYAVSYIVSFIKKKPLYSFSVQPYQTVFPFPFLNNSVFYYALYHSFSLFHRFLPTWGFYLDSLHKHFWLHDRLQKLKPCTKSYRGIKKKLTDRIPVNLTTAEIEGRDNLLYHKSQEQNIKYLYAFHIPFDFAG